LERKFIFFINVILLLLSLLSGPRVLSADADTTQGFVVANSSLGIHANAQLGVFFDLHLYNANILGSGTLTLQTNRDTKILSKNSTVNHLQIKGKNKTILKGDLHIISTLTLDQAIFVINQDSLIVASNAKITRMNGAKILMQAPRIEVLHRAVSDVKSNAAILNQLQILYFGYSKINDYICTTKILEEFQLPQFPPPKYLQSILKHKTFNKRIS
jgi:hypothetical protein